MTSASPYKLDDLTPHQLIDEIKQIAEQYACEVSTARRTWPKSVRDRVGALGRLGMSRGQISRKCGIPVGTVFYWFKKKPERKRRVIAAATLAESSGVPAQARFLAIRESEASNNSIPTVGIGIETETGIALEVRGNHPGAKLGLQIFLPGGIEVRGLTSVDQIVTLYQGCRS